ncbi:MAG: RidA family protein [Hyphomicrobiaceae bacterium]|nr:RidA family protein [Hyphomicrobiaceae bacterium]MCC0023611.1 RidA family protein [Hyphomicrobiaceae bacterium]
MTSPKEKLAELGLSLPVAALPKANYVPVRRSGNQIFVSGQVSEDENGIITGRLGAGMELEAGVQAAQRCALAILAQIEQNAGVPLDHIAQVTKLVVMVNSDPGFTAQPQVANGASDLMVAILGDRGRHARSAFGVAALPLGAAVEIEAIVDVFE